MLHRLKRRIEFDAGHRVLGHGGKCRHLHGHRYVCWIECECEVLNDLGMVVDFADVKRIVGGWVDGNLDHNMILHPEDPLLAEGINPESLQSIFGCRLPFIMPASRPNPTAENIAAVVFDKASQLLGGAGLWVVSVEVFETPNCSATHFKQ